MKAASNDNGLYAFIVADDLTGACDAAAPFAARMRVRVALDIDRVPEARGVAVNLGTRDVDCSVARTRLKAISDLIRVRKPQLLLKKVDSTFRGNTFEEISICLDQLPHEVAILAPAFPAQGRTVRSGHLRVEDISGRFVVDLISGLRRHKVECDPLDLRSYTTVESLQKRIQTAKEDGTRLLLCEAEGQSELNMLAQMELGANILWFGSAGLAHALARADWMPGDVMSRPKSFTVRTLVFCIGSDHPVTQQQIEHLKEAGVVVEMQPGPGMDRDVEFPMKGGSGILFRMGRKFQISAESREWLKSAAGHAGALILSGGDTAGLVCDALGTDSIEMGGELLPGIPFGWLKGGPADGVLVVTKSGGFGSREVLVQIAERIRSEAKVEA